MKATPRFPEPAHVKTLPQGKKITNYDLYGPVIFEELIFGALKINNIRFRTICFSAFTPKAN